jgi:hypothetical protein
MNTGSLTFARTIQENIGEHGFAAICAPCDREG